jgi:hypothetical protein
LSKLFDNPAAGTYKIIVTGTTVPLNTQEFSVVYDYVAPELLLTYPMGGRNSIRHNRIYSLGL